MKKKFRKLVQVFAFSGVLLASAAPAYALDIQPEAALRADVPAEKLYAFGRGSNVKAYCGNYVKYYGKISPDIHYRAMRYVNITRVTDTKNGKIVFTTGYAGLNLSPLYDSDKITAKLKNKKASFKWKDSWNNSGSGVIKIGRKSVKIKLKKTKTASFNRATLDTGGKYITLKK